MASEKPKILLQLDSDTHASVFDAVVAVDAGADQLFRHGGIEPTQVRDLVYGCMFTRGPEDLHRTAIFIGGANVEIGEQILAQTTECFFGPMRVSVMMDANGSNTTAAAAVLAARSHVDLEGKTATVLAGTGPVGQRVARFLAREGAVVKVGSRSLDRASAACDSLAEHLREATFQPVATSTDRDLESAMKGSHVVIAAGAPGAELLPAAVRKRCTALEVAIDLNAVSPVGIEGIDVMAKAQEQDAVICYGAIGVGGMKMKIHKAAIRKLFESNDQVFDADAIYDLACELKLTG